MDKPHDKYNSMILLVCLDAAEVVLFRCINRIQNDKGEVTAIEMSFEFLDDFQDPIKGGIYGLVNTVFTNSHAQDENLNQVTSVERVQKFPTSPVKFNRHNHVLEWMVCKRHFIIYVCRYMVKILINFV